MEHLSVVNYRNLANGLKGRTRGRKGISTPGFMVGGTFVDSGKIAIWACGRFEFFSRKMTQDKNPMKNCQDPRHNANCLLLVRELGTAEILTRKFEKVRGRA